MSKVPVTMAMLCSHILPPAALARGPGATPCPVASRNWSCHLCCPGVKDISNLDERTPDNLQLESPARCQHLPGVKDKGAVRCHKKTCRKASFDEALRQALAHPQEHHLSLRPLFLLSGTQEILGHVM